MPGKAISGQDSSHAAQAFLAVSEQSPRRKEAARSALRLLKCLLGPPKPLNALLPAGRHLAAEAAIESGEARRGHEL